MLMLIELFSPPPIITQRADEMLPRNLRCCGVVSIQHSIKLRAEPNDTSPSLFDRARKQIVGVQCWARGERVQCEATKQELWGSTVRRSERGEFLGRMYAPMVECDAYKKYEYIFGASEL